MKKFLLIIPVVFLLAGCVTTVRTEGLELKKYQFKDFYNYCGGEITFDGERACCDYTKEPTTEIEISEETEFDDNGNLFFMATSSIEFGFPICFELY